jgi:hypothetical protein
MPPPTGAPVPRSARVTPDRTAPRRPWRGVAVHGTTGCANDRRSPTKQRYSVRLTAPEQVNRRLTARRMDVCFTEEARGCALASVARGVVSWRGSRED